METNPFNFIPSYSLYHVLYRSCHGCIGYLCMLLCATVRITKRNRPHVSSQTTHSAEPNRKEEKKSKLCYNNSTNKTHASHTKCKFIYILFLKPARKNPKQGTLGTGSGGLSGGLSGVRNGSERYRWAENQWRNVKRRGNKR